jgi:hypothetical protein
MFGAKSGEACCGTLNAYGRFQFRLEFALSFVFSRLQPFLIVVQFRLEVAGECQILPFLPQGK